MSKKHFLVVCGLTILLAVNSGCCPLKRCHKKDNPAVCPKTGATMPAAQPEAK